MLATERIRSRDMQGRLTYSAIQFIKQLTGIDIHPTNVDIDDGTGDDKAIHPQYESSPWTGHLTAIGLVILHNDVIGGMTLVGIGHEGLNALPRQNAISSPGGMIGMQAISRQHQSWLSADNTCP